MKHHHQPAPPAVRYIDDIEIEDVAVPDPIPLMRRMTLEQQADEKQSQRMRIERLDFRNIENKTPIHLAAMHGHTE